LPLTPGEAKLDDASTQNTSKSKSDKKKKKASQTKEVESKKSEAASKEPPKSKEPKVKTTSSKGPSRSKNKKEQATVDLSDDDSEVEITKEQIEASKVTLPKVHTEGRRKRKQEQISLVQEKEVEVEASESSPPISPSKPFKRLRKTSHSSAHSHVGDNGSKVFYRNHILYKISLNVLFFKHLSYSF